jgi:hypothetical protein
MVLTTYHHLVARLRISGYIPLLHQYVLMAWTGTALLFNFAYTLYVSHIWTLHTYIHFSRNTVLSELGKDVVPWVNFWFFIFLFLTGLYPKEFQMLRIVAHLCGKWHLNGTR